MPPTTCRSKPVLRLSCYICRRAPTSRAGGVLDGDEADLAVRTAFERFDVAAFSPTPRVRVLRGLVGGGVQRRTTDRGQHRPQPARRRMRHARERAGLHRSHRPRVDRHPRRTLTHDGDLRLRHILNARRSPNRYGVSISKETRDSPHKIDLAVCLVVARHIRRLVLTSHAWTKR